jgi:CCR4-NOT transcriptional regulation complex NOT5 subunit
MKMCSLFLLTNGSMSACLWLQADLEARDNAERSAKKGKPKPTEKAQHVGYLIDSNNWHISRLEQIMRLLENDQVL